MCPCTVVCVWTRAGPVGSVVEAHYTASVGVRSVVLPRGSVVLNTSLPIPAPAQFIAADCSVVEAHRQINCTTAPGAGANIVWRLTIDGLTSQSPVTSYSAPSLSSLTMESILVNGSVADPVDPVAALSRLSTEGGELIRIVGDDFGPEEPESFVDGVWLSDGSSRLDLANCSFVVPHHELMCATPSGVGVGLRLKLSVLAQATGVSLETLSYSPPEILSTTPVAVPTSGTFLYLQGYNFGSDPSNTTVVLSTGSVLSEVVFLVPHRTLRVEIPPTALSGVSSFHVQLLAGGQVGVCH
jgi:hypothetical protein